MATLLVDKRDQLFVLKEMLNVEKLCEFPEFSDHSGFDMILTEAHRFAKAEFYPTNEDGDAVGCIFDAKTNSVKVPECYKKPYEKFREGGWLTMCDSPQVGGDGFPLAIGTAVSEMFYAAGEHDLTENIIHMVLARIDEDPSGTRGLSLFIVPKYLSDKNGRIGEHNHVVCAGIEKKMGLHGLVTCTLSFGDNGKCIGYLIGEKGKGIVEMFNMMNEQRLLVGLQGLSYSSAAFLHAADYACKRKQGRSVYPEKDKKSKPVQIIDHPDIKRMLLTMKAYVDGGRALAYFTSYCMDYAGVTSGEESTMWKGIADLLVPVVKAYLTDNSWNVTGMAIQCAGGYGYCSEYPFERLARDCKICSLYEGTNGIQAIDLMFRKLLNNKLVNFTRVMSLIDSTIRNAESHSQLKPYSSTVKLLKENLVLTLEHVFKQAEAEGELLLYAKATPYLEAMGDVLLGWLHLWQMTIVYEKIQALGEEDALLQGSKRKDRAFYYSKFITAQFFIDTVLRITEGKIEALNSSSDPVVYSVDKAFSD